MSDHFEKLAKSIYGWSVKDGKCVPPKITFPKPVVERIEYFSEEIENGLTFQGALEFIFAGDEKRCKEECEQFMDWLPVSDGFREWLDGDFLYSFKEEQIMLALIYGNYQVEEDK
ncbi:hypothetical protein AB662_02290 [Lactiplantibacillus plantarum]|nr:hypothetical protein AB662_02290 [Lactiplantibacillus plantarum]